VKIGDYETHPAADMFPLLATEQARELAEDIRTAGLINPIILTDGKILDGRNRLLACIEAGVAPRFVEWSGSGSPTSWVLSVNLHRRHLDESQRAMVGAKAKHRFEEEARGRQGARNDLVANLPRSEPRKSRDDAAALVHVSPRSVESAAKVLKHGGADLVAAVEAGDLAVSKAAQIVAVGDESRAKAKKADAAAEEARKAAEEARRWADEKRAHEATVEAERQARIAAEARASAAEAQAREAERAKVAVQNHRAGGTGENEWYTPAEYVEAARDVMGGIDLDPASSAVAQKTIKARRHYSKDDDGLAHKWAGRVWLNPPYAQPLIRQFADKVADEVQSGRVSEAIVLTHNYTDTAWFHVLAASCSAICFTRGRIGFLDPNGKKAAPTQGQAFFYFGANVGKFADRFAGFGFVLAATSARSVVAA
jgi:ParB family chromosome partitioning protein